MSFGEGFLTEDLEPLRHKLRFHRLWQRIEDGTLGRERLQLFALQDWWLVREAYRLDGLAISQATDLATQELLIAKLIPKVGGHAHLLKFGEGVGLTEADFEEIEPLAGCMALTNFFYWMIAYGRPGEKLAAVSASEDIFVEICRRVGPALRRHYGLTAEQVAFFTVHDAIGQAIEPVDRTLLARYDSKADRRLITRAVRLSHEFELMFYDTIMEAAWSGR